MSDESIFRWLAIAIPAAPAIAFVFLAAFWVIVRAPSEALARRVVLGALWLSALASGGICAALLLGLHPAAIVHLGSWFAAGAQDFAFDFRVDGLAAAMTALVSGVTALIGHFSQRYLHAQPGFPRFFMLLALFAAGMQLLVLGANLDQIFVGWELVGLTSALLVAFFHDRRTPVQSGLRVFAIYRICDLGLLVGAVLLHQASGTSDLTEAAGALGSHEFLGGAARTLVPLALLFAAMGKSAQFPVGGWLPRAMEGPTPSSALFYGALSVHAGIYLLLRAQQLIADSAVATTAVLLVGAATAVHGGLVGRVQTDAKSALAYATMTQLGVMLVEIALGLTTLATVHLFAHATLRAFQLLRVPSALRDAEALEAAGVPVLAPPWFVRRMPAKAARWVHRFALERFGLDAIFERWLIGPVLGLGQALDRAERRFLATLTGHHPAPASPPSPRSADEVPER